MELDFAGQCDLIIELPQDWNRLLEGTNKACVHQEPRVRAVFPQETEPVLLVSVQECLVETWSKNGKHQGDGHWIQECLLKSFWRRSQLLSLPLP